MEDLSKYKILYSPKEGTSGFWGLRDVPEKPVYLKNNPELQTYDWKLNKWKEALESCKSNGVEIVNPEVMYSGTKIKESELDQWYKPGDIFDLPEGYEFREEEHCQKLTHCYKFSLCENGKDCKKVLRLVKTETKEQSIELLEQAFIKPYFDAIANLAYRSIQFEDGEMKGFDMVMFESLLPILLKPIVPQPEPEESQAEVCQKVIDDIMKFQTYNKTTEHSLNHLLKNFTIQRKKQ